jgi:hypothetical protein
VVVGVLVFIWLGVGKKIGRISLKYPDFQSDQETGGNRQKGKKACC